MLISRQCIIVAVGVLGGAAFALGATDVPFEYHRGEILLSAQVGETGPWVMMLDTGTDPSALDQRVAQAAHLDMVAADGAVEGSGSGGGEVEVQATHVPRWQVGTLEAVNVETAVLDLGPIGASLGRQLDGIVGRSFLEGRIVQIDYPARHVRFLDAWPAEMAEPSDTPAESVVLPFEYQDGMILVPVKINGVTVRGLIDTGSNGVFKLTPAAIRQLDLEAAAEAGESSTSTGYRGRAQNRTGSLARVQVGSFEIANPAVVFFGEGMGHDDTVWQVNVGNRFLERYVVTIDYPGRRIRLTAAPAAGPEPE